MRSLTLLTLLSMLLTALAIAQLAQADEPRPLLCTGYPDPAFSSRLGYEVQSLNNAVRCRDLRSALRLSQALQQEIAREIEKGSTTEYGECYLDRKCTQRASQSTPTRDMCKAAEGKSWKRTSPSQGECESI